MRIRFAWLAGLIFAASLATAVACASTATAAGNVEVWSYSIAKQQGLEEAFPLPAPPFTFLSGALFFQDKAVVVAGDTNAMADKKYTAIGLGYGLAILAQMSSPPDMSTGLKCVGDGKSPDDAMMVEGWDAELTEVGAGMLCPRIDVIQRNGRSLWRLQAGPLSEARAREACDALAARGVACIVARD